MVSEVPPPTFQFRSCPENVVQWMSVGHFVQYEQGGNTQPDSYMHHVQDWGSKRGPRSSLSLQVSWVQLQKIQTTFLLHTPLKVVVNAVTTGIAEGSQQKDRLKAALCRIWDTKCNWKAASLSPSSSEVSQVQQIGRKPGWLQGLCLWRCYHCSTWTKMWTSHGIQHRRGTKRKQIPLKHLITCSPKWSNNINRSQMTHCKDHIKTYPLGLLSLESNFRKPLTFFFP